MWVRHSSLRRFREFGPVVLDCHFLHASWLWGSPGRIPCPRRWRHRPGTGPLRMRSGNADRVAAVGVGHRPETMTVSACRPGSGGAIRGTSGSGAGASVSTGRDRNVGGASGADVLGGAAGSLAVSRIRVTFAISAACGTASSGRRSPVCVPTVRETGMAASALDGGAVSGGRSGRSLEKRRNGSVNRTTSRCVGEAGSVGSVA